jgi:hypothetical protein
MSAYKLSKRSKKRDWESFKDGPHFELDRSAYPAVVENK